MVVCMGDQEIRSIPASVEREGTTKFARLSKARRRVVSVKVLLVLCFSIIAYPAESQEYVRLSAPEFFTYDELVALSQNVDQLAFPLAQKLQRITTTPFISNEAYYRGAKPYAPNLERIGPSLRVVFWNIGRGVTLDQIILMFNDSEKFLAQAEESKRKWEVLVSKLGLRISKKRRMSKQMWSSVETLREQINVLKTADVLVLNEVDWGMRRSGYPAWSF